MITISVERLLYIILNKFTLIDLRQLEINNNKSYAYVIAHRI